MMSSEPSTDARRDHAPGAAPREQSGGRAGARRARHKDTADPAVSGEGTSSAASPASGALEPWQFFMLAALTASTAAVFAMRGTTLTNAILVCMVIGAAGLSGYSVYRMLMPFVVPNVDEKVEMVGAWTRAALERDKALVLRSIKELEFDRAMGKVSDADFEEMSGRLRTRAIGILKQLNTGNAYEDLIEHELSSRRRKRPEKEAARSASTVAREPAAPVPAADAATVRPQGTCPSCGTTNDPDARFCKQCGSRIEVTV